MLNDLNHNSTQGWYIAPELSAAYWNGVGGGWGKGAVWVDGGPLNCDPSVRVEIGSAAELGQREQGGVRALLRKLNGELDVLCDVFVDEDQIEFSR